MRAGIAQSVRQLDEDSRQKIWQKGMKKAGGGPVAWRELRARTRHRGQPIERQPGRRSRQRVARLANHEPRGRPHRRRNRLATPTGTGRDGVTRRAGQPAGRPFCCAAATASETEPALADDPNRLGVDLGRGLGECASKTIMTRGFPGGLVPPLQRDFRAVSGVGGTVGIDRAVKRPGTDSG
jgi:hypothetical protein